LKALVAVGDGTIRMEERPMPPPPQGSEVNIRVLAAGICGSDLHIWHCTNPFATYPRVMGHEIVGEITEIGESAEGFHIGDRVIVNQLRACGECYACRKGRPNVCRSLRVVGVHEDGGFREYMQIPVANAIHLPDEISTFDAVMIEPMSIAVQGCWRASLAAEDTLLILGAGALGISLLRVARLTGAVIIVADMLDEKLEAARREGADFVVNTRSENLEAALSRLTDGYGPTAAIDAACFPGSLASLVKVIGNAGRIVTMNFSDAPESIAPIQITGREIDLRGSRLQSNKFPEVIRLIHQGRLSVSNMISHTFPFSNGIEAMQLAAQGRGDVHKIVLDMMQ